MKMIAFVSFYELRVFNTKEEQKPFVMYRCNKWYDYLY